MSRQFDSDIRVIIEHRHEGIESVCTGWQQACLTKLIEYIIDEDRNGDISQREHQVVCLRFLRFCRNGYLFLMIQETAASAQDDIIRTRLCHILERAVALDERMLIRAVASHDICFRILQPISVNLINPTSDKLYYFRILKPPYMVITSAVIT